MKIVSRGIAIVAIAATGLAALPSAFAHGDSDEELVAQFLEHIDDFEQEIAALVAQTETVAAAYAGGQDATVEVTELMQLWEAAQVHDVIEVKATLFYSDVWQSMLALKQSVDDDKDRPEVAAAAATLRSALWQSLGGLRLAAAQVVHGGAS